MNATYQSRWSLSFAAYPDIWSIGVFNLDAIFPGIAVVAVGPFRLTITWPVTE